MTHFDCREVHLLTSSRTLAHIGRILGPKRQYFWAKSDTFWSFPHLSKRPPSLTQSAETLSLGSCHNDHGHFRTAHLVRIFYCRSTSGQVVLKHPIAIYAMQKRPQLLQHDSSHKVFTDYVNGAGSFDNCGNDQSVSLLAQKYHHLGPKILLVDGPFKRHKVGLCVVCVKAKCVVDTIILLH